MTTNAHLYIFFFLLCSSWLSGQEFQKAFTDFNVANDISRDQEGNMYLGGYTTFAYDASVDEIISLDIINKLDAQGTVLWSKNFSIANTLTEIHKTLALPNGDVIVLFSIDETNENLQLGLARISAAGLSIWSQKISVDLAGFDKFNTELNLIAADGNNFYVQSKKINDTQQAHLLSKYSTAGASLWTKSYILDLKINFSTIISVNDNQLALIGHYTTDTNDTEGLLSIMDANGSEIISAAYDSVQIHSVISDGNDYIMKVKHATSNQLGLMKVDSNLDIVWAKEFDFEIEGQIENMSKIDEESFVLYAYDNRSRSETLARFDMDGSLIWAKLIESKYSGRPFYEKVIHADGQILVMSHIWTTALKSSIIRQMPLDGNTSNCILPSACLVGRPFTSFKRDLALAVGSASSSSNPIVLSLMNTNKSTEDFCGEQDGAPSPIFDLDSTACVNQNIFISNTNNQGADAVRWTITGGPEDAIFPLADLSPGVPISFQDSGIYTIIQEVEYKNCVSTFEQQTQISVALPFAFTEETLILCQDEIETVNANRPGFVSYLWLDDQSSNPIKKIDTPGIYTVELFDGSCTASYSLEAVPFDYSDVAFSLGPDTTVCEFRRFPLAADVIKEGTDYKWNDGPTSAERLANKDGLYTLTATLDGCDYVDDIFVTFEPCEPQIYMPNVFSPNADGFNDDLYPMGINYELVSFRIYNRWGALLHDGLSPWDGKHKNRTLDGMYIYNIQFLNIRSGDIERLNGSVYLNK